MLCLYKKRFQIATELATLEHTCIKNCINNRYQLQSIKISEWDGPTTIKFEVVPSKIRIKREVLYKLINVFTMIGVNANLLMGLSFLSFVELIFFWLAFFPRKYLQFRRKQKQMEMIRMKLMRRKIRNLRKFK